MDLVSAARASAGVTSPNDGAPVPPLDAHSSRVIVTAPAVSRESRTAESASSNTA